MSKEKDYNKPAYGMFGYEEKKNNWTDKPDQETSVEPTFHIPTSIKELKELIIPNKEELKDESNMTDEVVVEDARKELPEKSAVIQQKAATEHIPTNTDPTRIKWVVPEGTTAVYVNIFDKDGKFVDYYKVSRFITLLPGQTLEVVAKSE